MSHHAHDDRPTWSLGGVLEYRSRVGPDRLVLLFVAFNFLFLTLDVYLAHGFAKLYFRIGYEWIPVFTSPAAAVAALAMAMSARPGTRRTAAFLLAMAMMLAVGIVGFALHVPSALGVTHRLTWSGVVYAAPLLAPLSFAGVALVGVVAAAEEDPARPGRLTVLGGRLAAPFSRQQHLHLLNGLGLAAAALLAVIDHAQTDLSNPLIWAPAAGGFFLAGLTLHHGLIRRPRPGEKLMYFWAMLLAMAIGLLGLAMHLSYDLSGRGEFSWERLLKGAPPFAPLLFANMGLLGLLALIEPAGADATARPPRP